MIRKKKMRRRVHLDEFISAENLAKSLGVSKQTLLKWRGRGLPFVRIGFKVFFRKSSVAAWLAGRERKNTSVGRDV